VDPLHDLPAAAKPETLTRLIARLADLRPELRRECFDDPKKHVTLTTEQKILSEGEIVMALWGELYPDLEDPDSYGGGEEEFAKVIPGCGKPV